MISAVIPTKNEEETLPQFLNNLKNRLEETRYKIGTIIVDSSQDKTPKIANQSKIIDRVYRYRKEGLLSARDFGIRKSNGEIIVQMDVDSRYRPHFFENLLKPFKRDNVVMSYGLVEGYGTYKHFKKYLSLISTLLGKSYAPGGNRALDKEAYFNCGGYDLRADQPLSFLEGEVMFLNRIKEEGEIVPSLKARCIQSDRRLRELLS